MGVSGMSASAAVSHEQALEHMRQLAGLRSILKMQAWWLLSSAKSLHLRIL